MFGCLEKNMVIGSDDLEEVFWKCKGVCFELDFLF